jgi:hypothetical protein
MAVADNQMETNTCIIACETLKDELNLVMKDCGRALPVRWIDSGSHISPEKMRLAVQEAIDALPAAYTTVLLLFGFCGNAMLGISAGNRMLVLPRVTDCIPLFLGSRAERESYGTGTYFFTGGLFNSRGGIIAQAENVCARYGKKRGLSVMRKMLAAYRAFALIDTGAFDTAEVYGRLKDFAQLFDIPLNLIPGNLRLINALVSGEWPPEEFLLVKPGGSITFEDSLNAA